jgi:hypothetical protein
MMEFKKGMYVRIKNEVGYCVIGQIENINDYREPMMKYCIDIQGNDLIFIPENMIVKASNNIIDLIEVGDYVNGAKVLEIEKDYKFIDGTIRDILWTDTKRNNAIWDETIKSIVTKEMFESMEYKVN